MMGKKAHSDWKGMAGATCLALLLGYVSAWSGETRPSVAVATLPENTPPSPSPENTSEHRGKVGPEDLNARGQELENTFYEIDAQAPYAASSSTASTDAMPNPSDASSAAHESGSTWSQMKSHWSFWAAGAAGIVGLGTLGYLALADDEAKTPQKNVTIFRDK